LSKPCSCPSTPIITSSWWFIIVMFLSKEKEARWFASRNKEVFDVMVEQ